MLPYLYAKFYISVFLAYSIDIGSDYNLYCT